jgi:TRAP-type C4-dicarboxylate transport system permease small subunit
MTLGPALKLARWPGWARAAQAVGAALFAALFIVFLLQIAARFAFNKPLPWTDELAVILYVWVILWAAAFIVPEREHVAFDLVWNAVGRNSRRVMRIAGHLLLGTLAAWALPGCWDYVQFMKREGTPVLGVPFMIVFLPFVALLAALVLRSARAVWRAWHGHDLDDAAMLR